jgi:hypothetical protein
VDLAQIGNLAGHPLRLRPPRLDRGAGTREVAQVEALRLDAERIELAREVVSVAEELIDLAGPMRASGSPCADDTIALFFEAVHVEGRQVARITYREPFAGLLSCGLVRHLWCPCEGPADA